MNLLRNHSATRALYTNVVCISALLLLVDGMAWAADEGALAPQLPAREAAGTENEADDEEPQMEAGATAAVIGRIFGAILGADQFENSTEYEEEASQLIGEPAPDLELEMLDANPIRLSDLKGQVVVLDFWATWCGPCLAAMPHIENVQASFADAPVTVIGVNQGDEAVEIRETILEKNVTFQHALDAKDEVGDAFGVQSIPQTVLIDKQGVIQAVHVGYSPTLRTTLSREIQQLLDGEDLFDKEELAAANRRRKERRAEAEAKLGFCYDDRLQQVVSDPKQFGSASRLDAPYLTTQWVDLPNDGGRAMAFFSDEDLIVFQPAARKMETVVSPWVDDENTNVWDATPVFHEGAVCWCFLGATCDDYYDTTALEVVHIDPQGTELWRRKYEALETESYLDADVAAGDFNGDGESEIVLLVEDGGLNSLGLRGPGFSSRVLTVYGFGGETLLRTWAPGDGGPGLIVLPGESNDSLLLGNGERLVEFRVNLSAP